MPIYGELSADGKYIDITIKGVDAMLCALHVKRLTPTPKRKDGLTCQLALSWAVLAQLSMGVAALWNPGPKLAAWGVEQVAKRVQASQGELSIHAPDGLTPWPHQVEGALAIADLGRVLITDEPGTGKTITAILGLLERAARNTDVKVWPAAVLCPASMVDTWVRAWQLWAPSLNVSAWRGPKRTQTPPQHVYVLSYDTVRADASSANRSPLARILKQGGSLVLDECHYIKSPDAKRTKAVHELSKLANSVIALSGTPITRDSSDLWSTLYALEPLAWPARSRFEDRYVLKSAEAYSDKVLGLNPYTEAEFRTALLGQHRRVTKAEVLQHLPPKVDDVRYAEMPAAYRKAYVEMEKSMTAKLPDGGRLPALDTLTQLKRLEQMATSAVDVKTTTVTKFDKTLGMEVTTQHHEVTPKLPSWTIDTALEVLEERKGLQTVIFSPHAKLTKLMAQQAQQAGYSVGYIIGGQSPKVRSAFIDAFEAGELDVMCATTGAGGTGLTLVAASAVIWLEIPWSMVERLQATDRVHRAGSEIHESIQIIDIIVPDTIGHRKRQALFNKGMALAELLEDPSLVRDLLGGQT